jgi:hypothetical protein
MALLPHHGAAGQATPGPQAAATGGLLVAHAPSHRAEARHRAHPRRVAAQYLRDQIAPHQPAHPTLRPPRHQGAARVAARRTRAPRADPGDTRAYAMHMHMPHAHATCTCTCHMHMRMPHAHATCACACRAWWYCQCTCHMPQATCHMPQATCHMPQAICVLQVVLTFWGACDYKNRVNALPCARRLQPYAPRLQHCAPGYSSAPSIPTRPMHPGCNRM